MSVNVVGWVLVGVSVGEWVLVGVSVGGCGLYMGDRLMQVWMQGPADPDGNTPVLTCVASTNRTTPWQAVKDRETS